MQQKFFSNVAFLITLNFLVKPFWLLGIDRTVQNTVGMESYGLYFALFNLTYLFQIVLDLGLTNFNNRAIAREPNKLADYFANIVGLRVLLTFSYLLITFGVALVLKFDAYAMGLLAWLAANQFLASGVMYLRSNLSGLHLFRTDAWLSVLDKGLMILICAVLLWGNTGEFKIEWFIYAQTVSLLITILVSTIMVLLQDEFYWVKPSFDTMRSILIKSYPYALLLLMMAIYYRVDGVMIERMLPEDGAREAGYYASAYRLLDAVNLAGILFASILLPVFSRMLKQSESISPILNLSTRSLIAIAVLTAAVCTIFRVPIMELLYREATPYSADLFGLLIYTFIPVSSVYIFGTLLTANGNLKQLNYLALGGVALNILLNYILIQKYKAAGAAQATLITQVILASAHLILASQVFKFKFNWKLIGSLLLFAAFSLGVSYLLQGLDIAWGYNFGLAVLSGVICAFVLKLIDLQKLIGLLSERIQ